MDQLAPVAAHERLCFTGIDFHAVLGKPSTQRVKQVLQRKLQLWQLTARTADMVTCASSA